MSVANRPVIIEENFLRRVETGDLPRPSGPQLASEVGLDRANTIDIFESQMCSRLLDLTSREMRSRNESFYTIGSAGHEGNAVFGLAFPYTDMAFLHYRSGAFFVQRAKQVCSSTPLYDMLLSFAASSDDPISAGRHKVLGSVALTIPPQTSTIASHLPKAVGTALSITRGRDLRLDCKLPYDSVVLCSFGDASCNHATALSGLNTASLLAFQKIPLPLVFICEDNDIGISVITPEGWVAAKAQTAPGLHYISCSGTNIFDCYRAAREADHYARAIRRPVFLHMKTVRLLGHAGSDVETLYRTNRQIEETEAHDPLLYSAALVLDNQFLTRAQIATMYRSLKARIDRIARICATKPKLQTADEVASSIVPHGLRTSLPPLPESSTREALFGQEHKFMDKKQHMARLISWGLTDILLRYKNTVVFGEDVAKKGGVYHVTAGLWQRFGVKRVFNSPLDETSILGTAIGLAHNGFVPIPEIQFLAYVHNAEDQLRGEASTLSFFSNKQFSNPMVIRIAGLAYQKGFGGHFHNDNSLAVFRDIPGIIIACPANGADAVKMMRSCVAAAYLDGRITVFIEPIALYMTRDLQKSGDEGWSFTYPDPSEDIPIGEFAVWGKSNLVTIVTYGNGYYLSRQAAQTLKDNYGLDIKVIDLRWLAPINEARLAAECQLTPHVVIVDECRKTGSISEALVTLLIENSKHPPSIRRICADDCFIPLGDAATIVLPSKDDIIKAVLEITEGEQTARNKPPALSLSSTP